MRRPTAGLAAALAVCALSAAVASPALFALAVGLVILMAAAGAGLVLSARCIHVQRTVGASEVQEDAPIRLRFTLRGVAWLPVTIDVEDHRGGWIRVTGGHATLDLGVGRPGAYVLAPTRIRLRDAIGMFERQMAAGLAEPLLILPVPLGSSPDRSMRRGQVDDLESHGLRPYLPGTPIARIDWPALARGAGLHVRHFGSPLDGLPLVVVDTAGAPSPEALHWTARTAAGHVLALARTGGCRVLLPGDVTATSVAGTGDDWRSVHRRLAKLGAPPSQVTRSAAHTVGVRVSVAAAPPVTAPAPPLPAGILALSVIAPLRTPVPRCSPGPA